MLILKSTYRKGVPMAVAFLMSVPAFRPVCYTNILSKNTVPQIIEALSGVQALKKGNFFSIFGKPFNTGFFVIAFFKTYLFSELAQL